MTGVQTCALPILKKAGAWYSYEGEKVGQGKEAAKEFIKSHPDLKEELETRLKASMQPHEESDDALFESDEKSEEAKEE